VPTIAARNKENALFAANRAVGRVVVSAHAAGAVTRRTRVNESGSLRVRFPNAFEGELEAVLVNTAGGVAGGDRFGVDVTLGEGARLMVTTAAAEKVYRTFGPEAAFDLKLDVGSGAALRWLPQETILFDQARLSRRIEVDLAPDARLLLAETLVLGRSAMGEAVAQGQVFDRWRVRRGGRLVFAEALRFDGAIAEQLAEKAVAGGAVALATVLVAPGDDCLVARVRALGGGFRGEVAASCWNGLAVVRCLAADGAVLRHDLTIALGAVSDVPLPRLWIN
jgi:urease accessory protein